MIASLIDQLVMSKIDHIRLINILKCGRSDDNTEHCRSLGKLWAMLLEILRGFPVKVLVLLDALDECADRQDLADRLAASTKAGARFIITSRPEQDIAEMFVTISDVASIEMEVEEDIRKYVMNEVTTCLQLQPFQKQIISKIPANSRGMFRYAALMINEPNTASRKNINNVLNNMPDGLNEMYELILLRLEERHPKKYLELRQRILLWIATAFRPVRVDEMAYACAVDDGEEDFKPAEKRLATKKDMLEACGSLIEVFKNDSGNDELRFTHFTVKEFLLQPPGNLKKVDEVIRKCLVDRDQCHVSMALTCGT